MTTPITIRLLTGKIIPLTIDLDYCVYGLKLSIQKAEGIPPDQQRLIIRGRQMDDGKKLWEYGIIKGSTIELVLRLRGNGHPSTKSRIAMHSLTAAYRAEGHDPYHFYGYKNLMQPGIQSFIAEFIKNDDVKELPDIDFSSNANSFIRVHRLGEGEVIGEALSGQLSTSVTSDDNGQLSMKIIYQCNQIFHAGDNIRVLLNMNAIRNKNDEALAPLGYSKAESEYPLRALPLKDFMVIPSPLTFSSVHYLLSNNTLLLSNTSQTFPRSSTTNLFDELKEFLAKPLEGIATKNDIAIIRKRAKIGIIDIAIDIRNEEDIVRQLMAGDVIEVILHQRIQRSSSSSVSNAMDEEPE